MPVSFFQKLTTIFLLALSIDGNFDFLVVAARGSRLLPARRDFMCYRSLCYQCLLPKVAPAQLFSEINKWPNAYEDVFAPSIFHPPESY